MKGWWPYTPRHLTQVDRGKGWRLSTWNTPSPPGRADGDPEITRPNIQSSKHLKVHRRRDSVSLLSPELVPPGLVCSPAWPWPLRFALTLNRLIWGVPVPHRSHGWCSSASTAQVWLISTSSTFRNLAWIPQSSWARAPMWPTLAHPGPVMWRLWSANNILPPTTPPHLKPFWISEYCPGQRKICPISII